MKKEILLSVYEYVKTLVKWVVIAVLLGFLGGALGSAFHLSIDFVTELRATHAAVLLLLPVGGVAIAFMYKLSEKFGKIDTNRVIDSAAGEENVPIIMLPLIFVSSCITHLVGGSAGREGAALQLGGSMGYNIGRLFKMKKNDMHIIVMAGMSSVFSALFGTPLAAAFFAIEVACVGVMHYPALVPSVISAVTAYKTAEFFGISPVHFDISAAAFTPKTLLSILLLSVLCALVSIAFCSAIKQSEKYSKKIFKNSYLRAFCGGCIILALTLLFGTSYNGTGMDMIARAVGGASIRPEAFLLKIVFTAITVAAGFKGGEIVPAFFVGSTFGAVFGALLGIDSSLAAAVGFVALFCGVVNCPTASLLLALEVFGSDNILIFAIVCGVSYMMSGKFGLYKSQKILYSKLTDEQTGCKEE